ncbi:DUF58 domain-containing protein [Thalassospira sp.]|uniref:DUF58 domain-containing protein n=1 Tax=Thalassospira sp. TaxID=1912094 RepID=UPI0027330849|nr:DUF58 domain-containing protein [Thalassospira sp.]MDP2696589.1 DUF58 domain-containing protein [Thalassospira sp.]
MPTSTVQEQVARARSLAARLPQLVDESRRMATSLRSGLHGNRKVGPGSDFWQFRPYVTGDPASQIDWRRSARSDHTFIRQTEWQASHTYWIWPVMGSSMFWSSDPYISEKADRALVLALALADLLVGNGETVGTFDGEHTRITSAHHLEKLAHAMLASPGAMTEVTATLQPGRKHSVVVLSDFLEFAWPGSPLSQTLKFLTSSQNDGGLVQILDPAEVSPPFEGRVDLLDTRAKIVYRSEKFEDVRDGFESRARLWRARIQDAARDNNWLYDRHITAESANAALLTLYQHLNERQHHGISRHSGTSA